jgi:hypothetical protein
MPHPLATHITALLRQVRRIQRAVLGGLLALLACSVLLLTTAASSGGAVLLGLVLLGYAGHKGYHLYRLRQTMKQLRLEKQFLAHGPAPEEIVTCLRRSNHLWTKSLTLKGLNVLFTHPPHGPARPERLAAQYRRCFQRIFPARLPIDLLCFTAVLLLWLWSAPGLFQQPTSATFVVGIGLLLLLLVAETIQAVLHGDLRDGLTQFTTLLSGWTLDQHLDEVFQEARQKPYRHTAVYRTGLLRPFSKG